MLKLFRNSKSIYLTQASTEMYPCYPCRNKTDAQQKKCRMDHTGGCELNTVAFGITTSSRSRSERPALKKKNPHTKFSTQEETGLRWQRRKTRAQFSFFFVKDQDVGIELGLLAKKDDSVFLKNELRWQNHDVFLVNVYPDGPA